MIMASQYPGGVERLLVLAAWATLLGAIGYAMYRLGYIEGLVRGVDRAHAPHPYRRQAVIWLVTFGAVMLVAPKFDDRTVTFAIYGLVLGLVLMTLDTLGYDAGVKRWKEVTHLPR